MNLQATVPSCNFEIEQRLINEGRFPVAGVDEAGRGPLAGPVVAAAVILPTGCEILGLDDSKKLTNLARKRLYDQLTSHPRVSWATALRNPHQIDQLNILRATHEAMRDAIAALRTRPGHVLIDGLPVQPFPVPQTAIVHGDSKSISIAAASIIAKVTRDRIMESAALQFPAYGFDCHKGYPTPAHLDKLREHGPCELHRRSFAPVARVPQAFP